jgi:hypothetical protein
MPPPDESGPDVCAICLDSLEDGEHYRQECGHVFHAKCTIDWMRRGGRTCPCCREGMEQSAQQLGYRTIRARSDYLMNVVSRRNDAPRELKRIVNSIKTSQKKAEETRRKYNEMKREHRDTLKELSRLQSTESRLKREVKQKKRLLGVYHSVESPLPGLLIQDTSLDLEGFFPQI